MCMSLRNDCGDESVALVASQRPVDHLAMSGGRIRRARRAGALDRLQLDRGSRVCRQVRRRRRLVRRLIELLEQRLLVLKLCASLEREDAVGELRLQLDDTGAYCVCLDGLGFRLCLQLAHCRVLSRGRNVRGWVRRPLSAAGPVQRQILFGHLVFDITPPP